MIKNIGTQIIALYQAGFSYKEICIKLSCSKGTVSYHCGRGQKKKARYRTRVNRKNRVGTILSNKISRFLQIYVVPVRPPAKNKTLLQILKHRLCMFRIRSGEIMREIIKASDIIDKIGPNPTCYLTGDKIDLSAREGYSLDHIIPASRGGKSTIENLGVCTRRANQIKNALMVDELLAECVKILTNFGYKVEKPINNG